MNTLITLLVIVLILGLIWYIVDRPPLPATFKLVAEIILAIVAIVLLLSLIGIGPGIV